VKLCIASTRLFIVYIVDPSAKIIMHMYDDRGLDVIATGIDALRAMFDRYCAWILENRRQKVESRFKSSSQTFPE
jgi:hypothetical protein